ncbi:MAG: hypothetical protein J0L47_09000 [Flavobacteriales bacterium]|jgi:hypothetical protein|nr:hypothetical protein [Flavobacteriales bacterium]
MIKLFKKANMTVIPTLNLDYAIDYDSSGKMVFLKEEFNNNLKYEKQLLKWLIKSDVSIALGADDYGKTVTKEIDYITKHKAFK